MSFFSSSFFLTSALLSRRGCGSASLSPSFPVPVLLFSRSVPRFHLALPTIARQSGFATSRQLKKVGQWTRARESACNGVSKGRAKRGVGGELTISRLTFRLVSPCRAESRAKATRKSHAQKPRVTASTERRFPGAAGAWERHVGETWVRSSGARRKAARKKPGPHLP
jgi:hypothetical protein